MSVTNNSKNKGVINRTALEVWLDTDDAFIDGANTYRALRRCGARSETLLFLFFVIFVCFVGGSSRFNGSNQSHYCSGSLSTRDSPSKYMSAWSLKEESMIEARMLNTPSLCFSMFISLFAEIYGQLYANS